MKKLIIVLFMLAISCCSVKADKIALLFNGAGGHGMDSNLYAYSDGIGNWYCQLLREGYSKENIWVMDAGGNTNNFLPYTNPMTKPRFGGPFTYETRYTDSIFWFKPPEGVGMPDELWRTWVESPDDYDGDGISDVGYDATKESWGQVTMDMSTGSPDDELLVVLVSNGDGGYPGDGFTLGIWEWVDYSGNGYLIGTDQWRYLSGNELAGYIDRIPYARRNIIVETYNADAAWQYLGNDNTMLMASAQDRSWVGEPILDMSEYFSPFEFIPGYGMMGYSMPEGLEGAADANDDGRITWQEAWDWAYVDNRFGPDTTDPVWRWIHDAGAMGWATEYPIMFDPSGLAVDWVAVQFIAGDTNKDGTIDLQDFGILKDNFGGLGTWSDGDFNGDGLVDLQDFGILKDNFGTTTILAIPEPLAISVIFLGTFIVFFRRRVI